MAQYPKSSSTFSKLSPAMTGGWRPAAQASSAAQAYGQQRYHPRYWRQRRRWWRYRPQGAYSQWAAGIQACLAQVVGPWVPQNGIIGPQTRRAVQMFQGQQQMPATGILDGATVAALQSACSGQAPSPQGPPADAGAPPPPAPPAIVGPPGPPASAGPAASEGPSGAGAPDAAGEAEITAPEFEGETEHELRVTGQCRVEIESHDPVPFNQDVRFHWAPDTPAVYVVHIDGKPWHVGTAEHNLRCHLLESAKVLKHLNIPLGSMKNRSIGWVSLRSGIATPCAIQRRHGTGANSSFEPIHAKHGILRILKQLLSKKLATWNNGNVSSRAVVFGPGGSLTIAEHGKQIATLSAGNRL